MPEKDQHIPTPAPSDLPTFTIKVSGKEVSKEYPVQSIVVRRSFNKVASAEIRIYDGDPAAEDFKVSNTDNFIPGSEIEILAGYHGNEELIFKGLVIRHGLRIFQHKASILKVYCQDAAVKLTTDRRDKYFHDITDADLIEQLALQAGLTPDVDPTEVTHADMVQFYATDWDFILTRAEANSKQVLTHDGKLIVKAPEKKVAVLNLKYGGNMLDFEVMTDARDQAVSVTASAWNPAGQDIVASNGKTTATAPGNISPDDLAKAVGRKKCTLKQVGLRDTELQAWANSRKLKAEYAKVRGRVRIQGHAKVLPGNFINLNGVGERFNGDTLVSGIRHEISVRNWETDIAFGLDPEFFGTENRDIIAAPANGLLPAISGLQTALVTSLEDPEGEDRVQVRLPMIDPAAEGVWARVASLDAGEKRGSFFRPEVNDEVIVGFLNDDPRSPVVLGMLNSSAKPAPLPASDDNHEKGFVTRSEMKLLFNDDKISLTIETPNGNTLVISDEKGSVRVADENSNSIVMSSSGISIESASDIKIKATGGISLEGMNITAKASAAFKAEGSTGAELSSGTSTVVKGAIVQIN